MEADLFSIIKVSNLINKMAYLYRHIRLDKNIPFYIGIGNDENYKRANDRFQRNRYWKFVVNKTAYEVEILMENLSWDMACEKEKEFIQLYGRKDNKTGILVNLTDGGDGCIGIIMSQTTKDKISKAFKGKIFSEETKRKLSEKATGRKYAPEIVKRMSERGKLQIHSSERNKKIGETLKKKYASGERLSATKGREISIETRKKMSDASSGRIHTDEAKIKMSIASMGNKKGLGKRCSEEKKIKISLANRGKKRSEETKRNLSIAHIGYKHTDEQKKKISAALIGKKKNKRRVIINPIPSNPPLAI